MPLKYTLPWGRIIYDPAIVLNKDGSIQATWSYRGPDLDSTVVEQLSIMTQQLNSVFMNLGTDCVLYFEAQRHASTNYETDSYFPDKVTRAMDDERRKFFSKGYHFESEYYCTLYWVPPNDNEGLMKEMVIEGHSHKEVSVNENIQMFAAIADKIYSTFDTLRMQPHYLSPDEMLTYLHSIVSDVPRRMKMPKEPLLLDHFLSDTPLYGGIEPRLGKKHIRIITPTTYLRNTVFGMFKGLNQMDFEYRWVTRFYCLSKKDILSDLDGVRRIWNSNKKSMIAIAKEQFFNTWEKENTNAVIKTNEVEDAITAVEADVTSYGYFSSVVVVTDEDYDMVERKAKYIEQMLVNLGFGAKIEGLNSVDAWLGSLPGNVGRFVRRPICSCGNLIHMMPISDIWAGNARNKHLGGPPLIYTQTSGSTPFRLSLHVGDLGHAFIVGPTGAGKSVHLNLIAASFRKYKNARLFIFDKGGSSAALTAGVGGKFYDLGNESKHICFQPLAHIDDTVERQWALEWLCDFITSENMVLTPKHKSLLWDALNIVASYEEQSDRRMTILVNAVQSQELKTALMPLTMSGAYGMMFDSDTDSLDLTSWQTFEMEKIMQTPSIVGTVLMYIFHRIEQSLKGDPSLILLDECWALLDNEQFAQKIRKWLKELRKYNASVVFATQSLADITNSKIFNAILESCPSQIFLPNDKALEENMQKVYEGFGLNSKQIETIAQAIPKKHYYYVSPLGARLYDLALEHCPLSLAYLAVNKADTNKALEIINEHGVGENFNKYWMEYRHMHMPEPYIEKKLKPVFN